MANLKDLLVNGPSNLIGDVTVNKIRLTSLEVNNGTTYDPGSNGQVLKSNGTSVYWANDNNTTSFTIIANATDGLWDLIGTNGTNSVTYALAPYSSKQTTASFYTGTTAPSLSTRLNYDGYLYAKKLYSDGAETITKNGGTINNSLTLQKSSTSADSPELIFNGQTGNSEAYKWSIQKNSSGALIFSKINSNNTSTTTIVFSADGYLLPNTTDTYDLGSSSKKWRNIYGNLIGNADTATKLQTAKTINGTSFDGSANITTTNWGTARNLTIGNKTQSVDGSTNITWDLHDILKSGTSIGTNTSWDQTTPGIYEVASSSSFTGTNNPGNENTNNGINPYTYGQMIVSRAGIKGIAQFYISHQDSSVSSRGIHYRTGFNNSYVDKWSVLLDSSNYKNWTVGKDGDGTTSQIAYYSNSNTIKGSANLRYYTNSNSASTPATYTRLHIYGSTYGNTAANMISETAGLFSFNDGGPQITFDTNATPGNGQAGALIFTDNDSAGTGVSWHFVSNENDWNVTSKRFHARTGISIGTDLPPQRNGNNENTGYSLYVNGISYLDNLLKIHSNNRTVTIGSQHNNYIHIYSGTRTSGKDDGTNPNGTDSVPFIFNNNLLSLNHNDLGNSSYYFGNLELGFRDSNNSNSEIFYKGSQARYSMIRFLNNASDQYGNGISIGGGGLVIIGAGESATNFNGSVTASTEHLYLLSDSDIFIEAKGNSINDRVGIKIDGGAAKKGDILPTKAEGSNNEQQDLGASDNRWNNIYTKNIYITNLKGAELVNNRSLFYLTDTNNNNTVKFITTKDYMEISPYTDNKGILGNENYRWNKLYVNEFAPDEEYSAINIQFSNVWQDLKDSSNNLIHLSKSGTYIVQIYDDSHNDGASGHWKTYWSGIFSWYAGDVNGSGEYTEISLHGAGHAMNKKSIQLRTCSPLSSTMKFQIKGNLSTSTNTTNNTISIKFKFIM